MNISLQNSLNTRRLVTLGLAAIGLVALITLLTPDLARATVTVAEDDFEEHASGPTGYGWMDEWIFTGDAGYSDSGGPQFDASHLRLTGENATAVRSADVTGESSLRLQVWVKNDDFDDNSGVIEVSNDGVNYSVLQTWDDDDTAYAFYDFDLATTGLSFTSEVWVRARILGNEDDDGTLYLDQLTLINSGENPDPAPTADGTPVLIDGQFSDWPGKANLADPFGDQIDKERRDIAALYWANNIDEEINFHMLERHTTDGQPFNGSNGQTKKVEYIVYIDTNNNGNFLESADRRAVVSYHPKKNDSKVRVKIYPGDSKSKITDTGWNDWGDSREEGGLRVEFALDWNDLGIQFGGVIRMYAVAFKGGLSSPDVEDRVPDGTADIQWSPASVLGPWLLGAASVAGIAVIWFLSRRRRLWT